MRKSKQSRKHHLIAKMGGGTFSNEGRQCGFTLVELLVGMVVTFIVIGGMMWVITAMERSHSAQIRTQTMNKDGVSTLDYLAHYIMLAGYDPTGFVDAGFGCEIDNDSAVPPYAVEYEWNEEQIALTINQGQCGTPSDCVNNPYTTTGTGGANGILDDHWEERVVFGYDNDNSRIIRRRMDHSRLTLVENIDAMHVDYLDIDGNPITHAGEIAWVEITLVVVEPANSGSDSSVVDNDHYTTPGGTYLTLASGRPNPPGPLPDPLPQSYKLHRKLLSARVPALNN
jgi:type II secretory pathway pseudopilin PulG